MEANLINEKSLIKKIVKQIKLLYLFNFDDCNGFVENNRHFIDIFLSFLDEETNFSEKEDREMWIYLTTRRELPLQTKQLLRFIFGFSLLSNFCDDLMNKKIFVAGKPAYLLALENITKWLFDKHLQVKKPSDLKLTFRSKINYKKIDEIFISPEISLETVLDKLEDNENREAIKLINKLLIKFPDDFLLYYLRGNAQYDLQQFSAAVKNYSQTLVFEPEFDNALINRAKSYLRLKNPQAALADCDVVLANDERNTQALYTRGSCYMAMGEIEKGENDFNVIMLLNPSLLDDCLHNGLQEVEKENSQKAIYHLSQLVNLDKESPKIFLLRGAIKLLTAEYKKAVEDISIYLKTNKLDIKALEFRARAKYNLKEYNTAFEDFKQVSDLSPENSRAFYGAALCLLQFSLSHWERALEFFDKTIELEPQFANAYNKRGLCYSLLGYKKRACEDWLQAKKLGQKEAAKMLKSKCGEQFWYKLENQLED